MSSRAVLHVEGMIFQTVKMKQKIKETIFGDWYFE
jgi:hypothetical protein